MSGSDSNAEGEWEAFRVALIAFIEELAARVNSDGLVAKPMFRWRIQNSGRFTQDLLTEPWVRDESYGAAFHLESFARLRSAAQASPLGKHMWQPVGPSSAVIMLNLESYAIRTADAAVGIHGDIVTVNDDVVNQRYRDLRALLDAPQANVEVIVLLRGFWLSQSPLTMSEHVEMSHLNDQELMQLVGIGLVVPRLEYDRPNNRPVPYVELKDTDRVAFRRLIPQDNVAGTTSQPTFLNASLEVENDLGRLSDVVGLIESHWYTVVGWVARGAGSVLSDSSFTSQAVNPLPLSSHTTQPGFYLDRHREAFSRRWRQLVRAEGDARGAAARLAARRIGFAVTRKFHEDRLLDAMIALEAVLNDSETGHDIVGLIAPRAAHIWPSSDALSPRSVSTIVRQSYRLRNEIAHGDIVDSDEVQELSAKLLQVARVVVSEILDRHDVTGSYSVDWSYELQRFKERRAAKP